MILKEDDQSTVTQDGELIIKTFKPNHKFYRDDYEEWKNTCNHFSEAYGHFPKIIECDIDKIIMEKVNGETIDSILRSDNKMFFTNFDERVTFIKKVQYMYFKFISNLLEYNVENNISVKHNDLNCDNMIIDGNKLICVDLDSVDINSTPIDHYFITFGAHELTKFIDNALHQSYAEKQKEARKLNKYHLNVISKLKEELGKNK